MTPRLLVNGELGFFAGPTTDLEASVCNQFENVVPFSALAEAFQVVRKPVLKPAPGEAPNLAPLERVRPTDPAPVMRAFEQDVALTRMRWGFAPERPKAAPVINFRSEGRRFDHGRCLIPASAFFEFTGQRYPKTRWRFTLAGQPWFCFAGLWRRQTPDDPDSERFTLLTTAPGADMAPYHDRQPAVLGPTDWAAWLDGALQAFAPAPAGTFEVARDGPPGAEPAPSLFAP